MDVDLAYQLGNVSLPFYGYSMLGDENTHPEHAQKLDKLPEIS
jgi:hypothetical protein